MTVSAEEEDITKLVDELVRALVDDEESVSVEGGEEGNSLVINITVAEDEMGKVIGRQGRVIKAIRTLARAAGSRSDISVEVEVVD